MGSTNSQNNVTVIWYLDTLMTTVYHRNFNVLINRTNRKWNTQKWHTNENLTYLFVMWLERCLYIWHVRNMTIHIRSCLLNNAYFEHVWVNVDGISDHVEATALIHWKFRVRIHAHTIFIDKIWTFKEIMKIGAPSKFQLTCPLHDNRN